MFSKQAKTPQKTSARIEPLPAPAQVDTTQQRKTPPRVASLISADITVEGGLSGEGELQIAGVVRGEVGGARRTVGETGHVEGSVFAEAVEIRGRVVGAITAKQVRLYGTSYIDGDITHEQLAMETGAFFQGRSLKFQRPASQAAPAPTLMAAAPAPAPPPAPAPQAKPA